MSEENLVRQCAPTLAGIKTGTIFPAPFTSLAELTAEIRELNRILKADIIQTSTLATNHGQ